jgi:glutaredoxin-related protein
MEVILYSNECPKCKILKLKLEQKNIKYLEINDIEIIISKGFMSMPMLQVGEFIMNFIQANTWINERN